jgi:hypothetical protein
MIGSGLFCHYSGAQLVADFVAEHPTILRREGVLFHSVEGGL